MGAEVTAVDNGTKEAFLRRLGVDHFIDYRKRNFLHDDRTYDVIFDMVPDSSYFAGIGALRARGRYLCGNPRLAVMLGTLVTNLFTDKTATFAFAREDKTELLDITKMIEEGVIQSIVDRIYPMEDAAKAHVRVETEQRLGAVVLRIG